MMRGRMSTLVGWLRGVAERKLAALAPSQRSVHAEVRVESGLMRGVAAAYETSTLKFGAGPECDVVLMDDGVLPHHLTLRLVRSPFGTLAEIEAVGPVTIGGLHVEPGMRPAAQRLPLELAIAGTRLQLRATTGVQVASAGGGRALFTGLAILCTILALLLAAPLLQILDRPVKQTRLSQVSASVAASSVAPQNFPALIDTELVRLDLAGDVTVTTDDANATLVEGRIPSGKWPRWRSFVEWYDRQPGAPVLIQHVTLAAELTSIKPVAMVSLADPPRIHFADGQILGEGEVLQDGWVIVRISVDGIALKRGDDTSEFTF